MTEKPVALPSPERFCTNCGESTHSAEICPKVALPSSPAPTRGKFRKKPIVIEAIQYFNWMREQDCLPEGVVIVPWNAAGDAPCIHTLEGDMLVREGDWIITGVKGERYPCKPDIFAATYEPVSSEKAEEVSAFVSDKPCDGPSCTICGATMTPTGYRCGSCGNTPGLAEEVSKVEPEDL